MTPARDPKQEVSGGFWGSLKAAWNVIEKSLGASRPGDPWRSLEASGIHFNSFFNSFQFISILNSFPLVVFLLAMGRRLRRSPCIFCMRLKATSPYLALPHASFTLAFPPKNNFVSVRRPFNPNKFLVTSENWHADMPVECFESELAVGLLDDPEFCVVRVTVGTRRQSRRNKVGSPLLDGESDFFNCYFNS